MKVYGVVLDILQYTILAGQVEKGFTKQDKLKSSLGSIVVNQVILVLTPLKLPAQFIFQSTQVTFVLTPFGQTRALALPFNVRFQTIILF
jgi:hypothetical protein